MRSYVVVLARLKKRLALLIPVLTVLIALSLTSCRTPQLVMQVDTQTSEELRDTTFVIEADSSLIRALIECDSTGRAYLAKLIEVQAGSTIPPASVSIDNRNVLSVKSKLPQRKVILQNRVTTTYTERLVTNTVTITKMSKWQTFWYYTGQVLLVLILLYLVIRIVLKK